jgi:hypothetical protein
MGKFLAILGIAGFGLSFILIVFSLAGIGPAPVVAEFRKRKLLSIIAIIIFGAAFGVNLLAYFLFYFVGPHRR